MRLGRTRAVAVKSLSPADDFGIRFAIVFLRNVKGHAGDLGRGVLSLGMPGPVPRTQVART